jgi:uncharacterized membrane protein YqgA involved in biofilm formation
MEETRGKKMIKLFNSVAWFKVYFNSLSSYLGIINFLLLLLTFKSVYDINVKAIIIIPLAVLFGGLVGYIDYKYIQKPQNKISNEMNDLKHDLEEIKKELKEIKIYVREKNGSNN